MSSENLENICNFEGCGLSVTETKPTLKNLQHLRISGVFPTWLLKQLLRTISQKIFPTTEAVNQKQPLGACNFVNPLILNARFLDLLEMSENCKVFLFSWGREGCIGNKWVKNKTLAQVFFSEFYEIFRNTFFIEQHGKIFSNSKVKTRE